MSHQSYIILIHIFIQYTILYLYYIILIHIFILYYYILQVAVLYTAGRTGLVVSVSDCGVRGPRFESHRGRLCLSRQPLRYTALGTGCAPLLQCLG